MISKKHKKRLLHKFIQVFLTTFALLMILVGIGTVFSVVISKKNINSPAETSDFSETDYPEDKVVDGDIIENLFKDKKLTTFAVFGVDKDQYRTDVNMLVFFNHETAEVDILSIPRDTQVRIPDEIYATIQERRSDVDQIVKINEVPAYIIEDRNATSVAVLEKSLGIDIDYYINMNLDVFKFVVDEIGNITVDVPFDMEYSDPVQELYINIKKGEQTFNGAQAENLVRYRSGYSTGDIGRIEMQHNFMKAFVEQLLTTKNRLNMVNILAGVLVKVDTDFISAADYLVYLDKMSPDKFAMHLLPGKVDDSARSYFIYDYEATKKLLNTIVNDPYIDNIEDVVEKEESEQKEELAVDIEPEVIIDIKNLNISVQNGTYTAGLASRTSAKLEDEGFTVIEAVDFDDKPLERTKLFVPAEEVFVVLEKYFDNPEMILAPDMIDENIQIKVAIGENDVD